MLQTEVKASRARTAGQLRVPQSFGTLQHVYIYRSSLATVGDVSLQSQHFVVAIRVPCCPTQDLSLNIRSVNH